MPDWNIPKKHKISQLQKDEERKEREREREEDRKPTKVKVVKHHTRGCARRSIFPQCDCTVKNAGGAVEVLRLFSTRVDGESDTNSAAIFAQ